MKSLALTLMLVCTACAHPITIKPDMGSILPPTGQMEIPAAVGYYVPSDLKTISVETAGGGGDRVSYNPYADLDAGVYRVLSNIFTGGVYVIKDPTDTAYLRDKSIKFVFHPTIQTISSSRNIMFWPPTDFSVTITCVALDPTGREIWSRMVSGQNSLTSVSSTLHEFGITGRLAAQAALGKLQEAIAGAPEFRQ